MFHVCYNMLFQAFSVVSTVQAKSSGQNTESLCSYFKDFMSCKTVLCKFISWQ
jgi:hypothetical protein